MIILLIWCTPVLAQAGDTPPRKPPILTESQGEYPLGQHMEILEDPTGDLTIQDVSSSPFSDQFVPSQDKVRITALRTSPIGCAFICVTKASRPITGCWNWVFANTQYVDLYTPLPDGEGFITRQTGVLLPFETRDIADRHIVFDLPLAHEEESYSLHALPEWRFDDPSPYIVVSLILFPV